MQTKAKCVHHWNIAEPNGPISEGVCKNCGEKKEFQNSIFADTQHISLDREENHASTANEKKWNKWFGE